MRALVLVNPGARQGAAHATTARKQLWAMGVDVVRIDALAMRDWPALIDAHADGIDCVVVGGGDGTLNFAVRAIMRNGLTLGVLPLGTANDFARTLGIPTDPALACRNIAEGVDHAIDVGRVNDIHFLNVASIGLAVRARRYRSDRAKRRFGALGYSRNIYAAFRDTRPFRARVICDGVVHELRTIQIAVGNGHFFGGGLAVTGDAAVDDGRLDVFSLNPQGLGEMMRLLPSLVRGPNPTHHGGEVLYGRNIRVITGRRRSINTDGEVLTRTPADFTVLPHALQVRVPPAYRAAYEARTSSGRGGSFQPPDPQQGA